jgi:hypothetical protein
MTPKLSLDPKRQTEQEGNHEAKTHVRLSAR